MIKEAIVKIVNKEDLTYDEAYAVMNEIMGGETTSTQNAAFLAALSTKSAKAETTDEIAGCAAAMREHAVQVKTGMDVFEIVGTGGDNAQSFNISTTSALVAAAGGMKVAKHGNRAASSLCGTADCLEALGVNIDQSPEKCVELLNKVGMCFFFAQKYHTSMKYVGPIRKELGFRTVFNILGPLTNPGSPAMQLLGVYDEYLVEPLAQVLVSLGVKRGMVVYGMDKLDEISMSAPTKICEIKDGWFRTTVISPEDFGFERCTKEDLKGGTPEENAKIVRDILGGQKGHKRNAVLMNAGASLYIGGKADSMKEGIELAAEIIDSGKALKTLDKHCVSSDFTYCPDIVCALYTAFRYKYDVIGNQVTKLSAVSCINCKILQIAVVDTYYSGTGSYRHPCLFFIVYLHKGAYAKAVADFYVFTKLHL